MTSHTLVAILAFLLAIRLLALVVAVWPAGGAPPRLARDARAPGERAATGGDEPSRAPGGAAARQAAV